MKYQEEELNKLRYKQIRELRKKAVAEKDLDALLSISIHQFKNGSDATNTLNIPEMAYYFGRKNDITGFKAIIEDYSWALITLPSNVFETAERLFIIGVKFPYLSESELHYLDLLYSDGKTCQIMERMMFDEEQLLRPLKKFNKAALNIKHQSFPDELLDEVFECFNRNEDMNGSEEYFIYFRPENRIIRKKYQDCGLGDYVILQSNSGADIYKYITDAFSSEVAMEFLNKLYPKNYFKSAEDFAKTDRFCIDITMVVEFANEYFSNSSDVQKLKRAIARRFLEKCNEYIYEN